MFDTPFLQMTRKFKRGQWEEFDSRFTIHDSPDFGLTRNTRCRCYRCSVPGLAGFTRRALCGARSL